MSTFTPRVPGKHRARDRHIELHRRDVVPRKLAAVGPSTLATPVVHQVPPGHRGTTFALGMRLHERFTPAADHREDLVAHLEHMARPDAACEQRRQYPLAGYLPRRAVCTLVDLAVAVGVAAALSAITLDRDGELDRTLASEGARELVLRSHRLAIDAQHPIAHAQPHLIRRAAWSELDYPTARIEDEAEALPIGL